MWSFLSFFFIITSNSLVWCIERVAECLMIFRRTCWRYHGHQQHKGFVTSIECNQIFVKNKKSMERVLFVVCCNEVLESDKRRIDLMGVKFCFVQVYHTLAFRIQISTRLTITLTQFNQVRLLQRITFAYLQHISVSRKTIKSRIQHQMEWKIFQKQFFLKFEIHLPLPFRLFINMSLIWRSYCQINTSIF